MNKRISLTHIWFTIPPPPSPTPSMGTKVKLNMPIIFVNTGMFFIAD